MVMNAGGLGKDELGARAGTIGVPGEDLSQRIARGAILVDEALPIAKQIAEALEAVKTPPMNAAWSPDGMQLVYHTSDPNKHRITAAEPIRHRLVRRLARAVFGPTAAARYWSSDAVRPVKRHRGDHPGRRGFGSRAARAPGVVILHRNARRRWTITVHRRFAELHGQ